MLWDKDNQQINIHFQIVNKASVGYIDTRAFRHRVQDVRRERLSCWGDCAKTKLRNGLLFMSSTNQASEGNSQNVNHKVPTSPALLLSTADAHDCLWSYWTHSHDKSW